MKKQRVLSFFLALLLALAVPVCVPRALAADEPLQLDRDYTRTFSTSYSEKEATYSFSVTQRGVLTLQMDKPYSFRTKLYSYKIVFDNIYSVTTPIREDDASETFFRYQFIASPGAHTLKFTVDSLYLSYGDKTDLHFRVSFRPDQNTVDINQPMTISVGPIYQGYSYHAAGIGGRLSSNLEKISFPAEANVTYRIGINGSTSLFSHLLDGEGDRVQCAVEKDQDALTWTFTAGYTETYTVVLNTGWRDSDKASGFTVSVKATESGGKHIHSVTSGRSLNNGTHSGVCDVCGESVTVPCTYREEVTPPTATTPGYSVLTCYYCGYRTKGNAVSDENSSDARQMGDVDNDGIVSSSDARLVLRASVRLEALTGEQLIYSDCDYSGAVEPSDARTVLRCAVRLDPVARHDFETKNKSTPSCERTGEASGLCRMCGKLNNVTIPALGHDLYETAGPAIPTCTSYGAAVLQCSRCNYYTTYTVPPLGHDPVAPTCSCPSYCSRCFVMLGMPIRHDNYGGYCRSCGKYIPSVLQHIEIYTVNTSHNSVGGVDVTIGLGCTALKPIKYLRLYVTPFNAVGDPVYCDITGEGQKSLLVTGPLNPGDTDQHYEGKGNKVKWHYWSAVWYNYSEDHIRLDAITIEYMDGTTAAYYGEDARAAIIGNWYDKVPTK